MPKGINTREKKVYFGKDEWETVCRKADAAEMKVGTYIRYIAVHGMVKKYDVAVMDTIIESLNHVGRNINQVAKKANTSGEIHTDDIVVLKDYLESIKDRLDVFLEHLPTKEIT